MERILVTTTQREYTLYLSQQEKNDVDLQMDDETAGTIDFGGQLRVMRNKLVSYIDYNALEAAQRERAAVEDAQINPRDARANREVGGRGGF